MAIASTSVACLLHTDVDEQDSPRDTVRDTDVEHVVRLGDSDLPLGEMSWRGFAVSTWTCSVHIEHDDVRVDRVPHRDDG